MLSLTREVLKQRTRLHHQHKDWERKYRDDNAKIQKKWKKEYFKKSYQKKDLNRILNFTLIILKMPSLTIRLILKYQKRFIRCCQFWR